MLWIKTWLLISGFVETLFAHEGGCYEFINFLKETSYGRSARSLFTEKRHTARDRVVVSPAFSGKKSGSGRGKSPAKKVRL